MGESVPSYLGIVPTEDTSLILPSDKKQCTGQQRVLQQVKSIKRSKSKIVKTESVSSPTSPASLTEYSEPKFQFSPTTRTTSTYSRTSTNTSRWQSQMDRHYTVRRPEHSISQSIMNGQFVVGSQNKELARAATEKRARQPKVGTIVRSKSDSFGMNGATWAMDAMTLQEAVEFLTHTEMYNQLCGASFIQHCTYVEDTARKEVGQLGGIHSLIQMLNIDNLQIQRTVAAALRNAVFKDSENKSRVKLYGGIDIIVDLLKSNKEMEIQNQLTGLLWNLSSADDLKSDLNKTVLSPLTESILVPYTMGSDSITNKLIEPEVFLNTTGCIRNLSSSGKHDRILMRNCPHLIDSLMAYLQGQLEIGELDDKSLENCVCILHNLSYQLDKEAPKHFSITEDETTQKQKANEDKSKNSIFSSKSTKNQKELSFPAMDILNPTGVSWLYNRKSLDMYLSLLRLSQKEATLEACCGALQNLTASKNLVSTVMSQAFKELNGLPIISSLLKSNNKNLQKTAISVLGNMSRVSNLRATLANAVLPQVSSFLSSVTMNMVESDDTIAIACHVMQTLAMAEPEHCKKVFNRGLIMNLSLLSENMSFLKARQPAGALLYSLWKEKDIYSILKKQGMIKDTFVNTVTCASYRIITGEPIR